MPLEPSFFNSTVCLLDTAADNQQQVDLELLLGTEIDNLRAQIQKKDTEIVEKGISFNELQRQYTEIDEQLRDAKQDHAEINYLKETKERLVQKLKTHQDELQTLKEDKATYKNTLDFIVTRDSRVKKNFQKKSIILQRRLKIEQKNVTDIKQDLERVHIVANEYKEKIESLSQEKRDLEQRISQLQDAAKDENARHETNVKEMAELIHYLRQQIEQAHLANEDQRSQFEEEQAQYDATFTKMTEKIEHMKDKIQHLEESLQRASALSPFVSGPLTLKQCFLRFIETKEYPK